MDQSDIDRRRQEGLDRIAAEVESRRKAGLPAVPAGPIEGVPFVTPRVPPDRMVGAAAAKHVDKTIRAAPTPPYRVRASAMVDQLQQPYGAQVTILCGYCGEPIVELEVMDEDYVGMGFDPKDHLCPPKGGSDEEAKSA